MKLKSGDRILIDSRHYGFPKNHVVALYLKGGEWRIYDAGCYPSSINRKELIEEVCGEKRVKPENVRIGSVESLAVVVEED